ncbi:MAG: M23 family metallopeptidase [Candidatus Thorarchaeota archaeon]|nr:MAG: M23 family metallopeptidase [Candidatus Thorarchaeota archaeon]
MKKQAIIIIVIIVIGLVGFGLIQGGLVVDLFPFDTEGRYDSSELNDMGVIYANRSDIESYNEGYSESDSCPWGFIHNGIDFFYFNNSDVIAGAPGLVERIDLNDWGPEAAHRYTINVEIKFNYTVSLWYGFEPWTNSTLAQAQQVAMFNFEVGTWVAKGDVIAKFLAKAGSAHIHFGVVQEGEWRDPTLYMSNSSYDELQEMIWDFHPSWSISYP